MIHNIIGDDIISYSDLAHTLINDSKLRNYFVHIDSKEAEFDNGEYIIKPYDTGFKLYSTEKKITKNKKSKSGLIYASYTEAYTYIKYRLHWDDLGFSKFNSDLRPTRPNFRSFIDRCFTYYGEGKFIEFDRLHNDLISEIQVLSRKTLTHKEIEAIKLLGTSEENVIAKSPEMGVILKIECTDIYDNNIDFNISLKTSESKASLEQWYKDNKVNLIRLLNYNKRLKYRRINLALYKVDSVTISDGNIMRIVFKKERK